MEKNIVSSEFPIDIEKLSLLELSNLLKEELVFDDIKDYITKVPKIIKEIKSSTCNLYNCKLQELLCRDIIIMTELLKWLEIVIIEQEKIES